MFKAILENLKSLIPKARFFDPGLFNDPVALTTEWTPAKGGGTNFKTHKLVVVDQNRLEFRPSIGLYLFCGVFASFGLFFAIIPIVAAIAKNDYDLPALLIAPLFGLLFAGIGFGLFYFSAAPIIFDKLAGEYWKGRKKPSEVFDRTSLKNYTELKNIHALQIIAESCKGKNSSFVSYEINLVLHDGRRYNVVDHGSRKKIKEDANTLADFLKVPVWDTTV